MGDTMHFKIIWGGRPRPPLPPPVPTPMILVRKLKSLVIDKHKATVSTSQKITFISRVTYSCSQKNTFPDFKRKPFKQKQKLSFAHHSTGNWSSISRSNLLSLKHESLSAPVRSAFVHVSCNSHPYMSYSHYTAKWILNKCVNEWLRDLYFRITDTKHSVLNKFTADDATDTNCLRFWFYNWVVCFFQQ